MDEKEEIRKLKDEKNYEEIYRKFGRKAYLRNAPFLYKRRDYKKIKSEGRIEDIYLKYGERKYNRCLFEKMFNEIKSESGSVKAYIWEAKKTVKCALFGMPAFLTLTSPAATGIEVSKNAYKYESQIEDYNEKVEKYANEVNELNLSDIQIFMKVMDDMWGGIKGYKNPELNIQGFLELDLANEDGYGVCRNMASDIAEKLNQINPKYNAKTIVAYMGNNDDYQPANIARNILVASETAVNNGEAEQKSSGIMDQIKEEAKKFLGNHMVTLASVPEENIIVVLDPTNSGIGIYKDGNIHMFNSTSGSEIEYDAKQYMTWFGVSEGYKEWIECIDDYFKSFEKSKLSEEELKQKYGLEAQNKALEEVRKIQKTKDDSRKNQFKEELTVKRLIKNQKVQEMDKIEREDEAR